MTNILILTVPIIVNGNIRTNNDIISFLDKNNIGITPKHNNINKKGLILNLKSDEFDPKNKKAGDNIIKNNK